MNAWGEGTNHTLHLSPSPPLEPKGPGKEQAPAHFWESKGGLLLRQRMEDCLPNARIESGLEPWIQPLVSRILPLPFVASVSLLSCYLHPHCPTPGPLPSSTRHGPTLPRKVGFLLNPNLLTQNSRDSLGDLQAQQSWRGAALDGPMDKASLTGEQWDTVPGVGGTGGGCVVRAWTTCTVTGTGTWA